LEDDLDNGFSTNQTNGTLTFAAGETSKDIFIETNTDSIDERDESIFIQLSNPSGAVFSGGADRISATGLILDDDGIAPSAALTAAPVQLLETLSQPSIQKVGVDVSQPFSEKLIFDVAAIDGTALEGTDFTLLDTTLTFAPGQTLGFVRVVVLDDSSTESEETFSLSFAPQSGSTFSGTVADAQLSIRDGVLLNPLGGDEILNGDGDDETLDGGAGDDILVGGGGNDVLIGGDGIDTADYSSAAASTIINLASGAANDGDGGTDTLIGIENIVGGGSNDVLIGNSAANTLTGGAGVDRLDGRDGNDILFGGAGNDIYTVADSGDLVFEQDSGGARDRINVFVDYVNAANVEFLVGRFSNVGLELAGSEGRESITGANKINSADTLDGRGGNDKLVGLVGDDTLIGGIGNDRIFGNSGADIIIGGRGNDRVTGQQGGDTFVHTIGDGRDRITDFNVSQDLLDLTGHDFSNFAEVQALMSNQSGTAVIDLAGTDAVLLQGIAFATIGAEDVLI
jgi:Ca2+-binding RTX toxin-like protein